VVLHATKSLSELISSMMFLMPEQAKVDFIYAVKDQYTCITFLLTRLMEKYAPNPLREVISDAHSYMSTFTTTSRMWGAEASPTTRLSPEQQIWTKNADQMSRSLKWEP